MFENFPFYTIKATINTPTKTTRAKYGDRWQTSLDIKVLLLLFANNSTKNSFRFKGSWRQMERSCQDLPKHEEQKGTNRYWTR